MAVVTSLLKVALLGAVVALYWRPLEIAKAVGVPPPEGGFQPAQVQVVRFLLSIMAYMSALSSASSWFATMLVLIALQTVCMAIGITDQRVLNDALDGVLDAASEKQLFETSAVVLYGLLLAVLLFGGRTNGKSYHRRRLMAFYAKHNPDKLADVGKILKKYEGKEELLFSRLHRKYSRVLSHTPAEDAVDDLDHSDDDQDEDVAPEGAFIEEVEYIQATSSSSPTSSSTSSYSKTVVSSSKTTTTFSASNDDDEDDGGDEASLPMLQPRVKSPVTKSPVGSAKAPSVPPSPALSQSAGGTGSKAGSAAGSAANSPPRSPGAGPSQANSVRKASEDARRALQERVQQRVAQLQKKKK